MNIQCPYCCTVLELPDESVGWKVQCVYCNEKFIATEEFIRKQKEAMKKKTIRLGPIKRKAESSYIVIKRPTGKTSAAPQPAQSGGKVSVATLPPRQMKKASAAPRPIDRRPAPSAAPARAAREFVTIDGEEIEIPPNAPFWVRIPTWLLLLTSPIWFIPWLLYIMVEGLNPFAESDYDRRVRLGLDTSAYDDDAWSYAERERWQWTLGTGRYAEND